MVLALVGSIFMYVHVTEIDRVNATEQDRLHVLTNVVASDIQNNLQTVNLSLEGVIRDYLAGHSAITDADHLQLRLRALKDAMPGIRALLVLDANGVVVSASKPSLVGRNLVDREYFKVARNRPNEATLYVSPPFQSLKDEPDLVIAISRFVPGAKGEFAWLVVAALDQDYFADSFTPVVYAPDVWAFVVHGDGLQILNYPKKANSIDGTNLDRPGTFFSRHLQSAQLESVLTGTVYTTGEKRLYAPQSK